MSLAEFKWGFDPGRAHGCGDEDGAKVRSSHDPSASQIIETSHLQVAALRHRTKDSEIQLSLRIASPHLMCDEADDIRMLDLEIADEEGGRLIGGRVERVGIQS